MSFISLLFPSIFGIFMVDVLDKEVNIKTKEFIYLGATFTLITNSIMGLILKYVYAFQENLLDSLNYPSFFAKYVLASLCITFILSIIFVIIKRHISIAIETTKIEKKKPNKKKKRSLKNENN